jgi:amino acid adenylation domain-containing protein
MRFVYESFEEQALQTPEAIAVVAGGEQMSYSELDKRANRVAHHLCSLGVAPEVPVGLCMKRSVDMVVGILAILKAGGVYLPIDLNLPAARAGYIREDAQSTVLILDAEGRLRVPVGAARVVDFKQEAAQIEAQPITPPVTRLAGENLAYIMYTSGTTGRPKGVGITHRGLANMAQAQRKLLPLGTNDAVLQWAALSFDAAVWEWVMALLAGARLVLSSSDSPLMGVELRYALESQGITTVTLTPSALATMGSAPVQELKNLIVAGEACGQSLIRTWAPGRRMLNAYGPTEVTVCATASPPLKEEERTIGAGIEGVRTYVVTEDLELCPRGAVGELLVGGPGVARGYLNHPAMTAESFIPDPFSGGHGERLYKTGDLVKEDEGGLLEFVGRKDGQMKIRGMRIEPGEIEEIIREETGLANVVVLAQEDASGNKKLFAYIEGGPLSVTQLQKKLEERLPLPMVPATFICLPEFPRTPSGKIDKNRLPDPDHRRPESDTEFVAPRTPIEEKLAAVWCELLELDKVGVKDSFFELGGHSLLLTPLSWRIAEEFGVELSLPELLQANTIEEITVCILNKLMTQPAAEGLPDLVHQLGASEPDTSLEQVSIKRDGDGKE